MVLRMKSCERLCLRQLLQSDLGSFRLCLVRSNVYRNIQHRFLGRSMQYMWLLQKAIGFICPCSYGYVTILRSGMKLDIHPFPVFQIASKRWEVVYEVTLLCHCMMAHREFSLYSTLVPFPPSFLHVTLRTGLMAWC